MKNLKPILMQYNSSTRYMLLIKEESKTTDVFHTALSNFESKHSITVFKDVKLCLKYLKEESMTAPMLFFNLTDSGCKCLDEIVAVRNDKKTKISPL